jgi:lipoprotein-anchoring transpeptidase ErfK/SrfK
MAKPGNTVRVSTNIGDGNVVGVGMPLVVRFDRSVPKDYRDDIERRLWVTTAPVQAGSWHWFSDKELHYRPKEFWQAGTKLDFRLGTGGLPLGSNWYGRADLTVDAKIRPDSLVMSVDNATKKMTVTYKGQVVKTIPVSLGKTATPSSSGTMVVMERLRNTIFDTTSDPNPVNRYKIPIEYAQRLTWGGEFIHAAPWSVASQGVRNVSHGCVNMSMENAAWLFNLTKVGDPITVKGTERTLQKGNGWTDWSMSWDEYVQGAALPRTETNPAPSATPSG